MDFQVLINCILIVIARVCDVSLGTLRTISVMHGRRSLAILFGFFEVLIWVTVVSRIISTLSNPFYAVAYASGFAAGNFVGLYIESLIGWGEQLARIFTRDAKLEAALRDLGYRVTVFEGRGMDGPVLELFIQASRKSMPHLLDSARKTDPHCFYLVENVSYTSRVPQHENGTAIRKS